MDTIPCTSLRSLPYLYIIILPTKAVKKHFYHLETGTVIWDVMNSMHPAPLHQAAEPVKSIEISLELTLYNPLSELLVNIGGTFFNTTESFILAQRVLSSEKMKCLV